MTVSNLKRKLYTMVSNSESLLSDEAETHCNYEET